jgi:cytochrome c-type biogenesis protein CcmH/NrfG
MSAKYKADLAKLENTEKSLTFASQYFIDLYTIEQDTALKVWQAAQAAELLEKAVAINSSNISAKVKLAQSYTDGTGETMKGVLMLREVAQADPSNLAAGITLGRLAVQSGQFDKAITRLEKLLIAHPENTEAMYFLAESYKGQGNTAKAKELFNECKKIVNNPNFTKEIDDYIKTF